MSVPLTFNIVPLIIIMTYRVILLSILYYPKVQYSFALNSSTLDYLD